MTAVEISNQGLAIAGGFVILAGLVSFSLRLGVQTKLWIASARTIVQLGLLGLVLKWVFEQREWYLVTAVLVSMIINAGIAAVRRTELASGQVVSSPSALAAS